MSGAEAAVIAPMMAEVLGPGLAGAGMGAAGAAAAPAALGAAGAAAAPSMMGGLYNWMLPGVGTLQGDALAAQIAAGGAPDLGFQLAGLANAGNAAASVAGSPFEQSLWSGASQLTGPLGTNIGNAADLGLKGMRTMQAAQALGQPQGVPQRRSIQMAPMAQGLPPSQVKNPIQLAQERRYLKRMQGRV